MAILVHQYLHQIKDLTYKGVARFYIQILSILESIKEYEYLYNHMFNNLENALKEKKKKTYKKLSNNDLEIIKEEFENFAETNLAVLELI